MEYCPYCREYHETNKMTEEIIYSQVTVHHCGKCGKFIKSETKAKDKGE